MGGSSKIEDQEDEIDDCVRQRTLKTSISCKGVGLHSGVDVNLTLMPTEAGTGIVFDRIDIHDKDNVVPGMWDRVVDTRLCTAIGNDDGVTVSTIEHLMAALAGCGIDNVRAELDGPEVPIMDGSSEPFVVLIRSAGVVEQSAPRRVIRILKAVNVEVGDSQATLPLGHGNLVRSQGRRSRYGRRHRLGRPQRRADCEGVVA